MPCVTVATLADNPRYGLVARMESKRGLDEPTCGMDAEWSCGVCAS